MFYLYLLMKYHVLKELMAITGEIVFSCNNPLHLLFVLLTVIIKRLGCNIFPYFLRMSKHQNIFPGNRVPFEYTLKGNRTD